jgi:hypothetical protein
MFGQAGARARPTRTRRREALATPRRSPLPGCCAIVQRGCVASKLSALSARALSLSLSPTDRRTSSPAEAAYPACTDWLGAVSLSLIVHPTPEQLMVHKGKPGVTFTHDRTAAARRLRSRHPSRQRAGPQPRARMLLLGNQTAPSKAPWAWTCTYFCMFCFCVSCSSRIFAHAARITSLHAPWLHGMPGPLAAHATQLMKPVLRATIDSRAQRQTLQVNGMRVLRSLLRGSTVGARVH